jgi:nicotinamide mononucleotide adenylyltransferase
MCGLSVEGMIVGDVTGRRQKVALTFGRFPIITHGHLAFWREILKKWDNLVLGVLDIDGLRPFRPDDDAVSLEFYSQIVQKCNARRNPFSADERMRMLNRALAEAGLTHRVRPALVPIPELNAAEINEMFPPNEVDIVTGDLTDPFEQLKIRELERLLDRSIFNVESGFRLHTTEAKEKILQGDEWASFVPPGAYEVFLEIDGPARLPADS